MGLQSFTPTSICYTTGQARGDSHHPVHCLRSAQSGPQDFIDEVSEFYRIMKV